MSDSKAIQVREHRSIEPTTFGEAMKMATVLAQSGLIPRDLHGKEADVLTTLLAGHELGLGPMTSLRSIHVVKGKPVLAADLMVGIVLGSGLAEYFRCVESTAERATYETRRRGDKEPQRASYTIAEAKTASLAGKDNWKAHTAAMLRARAKSILARDAYPDILHGVYSHDEAEDFVEAEDRVRVYSAPPPPAGPTPAPTDASGAVIDVPAREYPEPDDGAPTPTEVEAQELRELIEAHDFTTGELPDAVLARITALPQRSAEREELRTLYAKCQAAAKAAG